MAKFEDVLPALRKGKKIRRSHWDKPDYIYIEKNDFIKDNENDHFSFHGEHFEADDWEIVPENPKCICGELYRQWYKHYPECPLFCKQPKPRLTATETLGFKVDHVRNKALEELMEWWENKPEPRKIEKFRMYSDIPGVIRPTHAEFYNKIIEIIDLLNERGI